MYPCGWANLTLSSEKFSVRRSRAERPAPSSHLRSSRGLESGVVLFHDPDLFLEELLDAVLGHEDVRDGNLQALSGLLSGETFHRQESKGFPGDRFDPLGDTPHRHLE